MHGAGVIFAKELRGYFLSPIAYVVGGVYLMVIGFFFGSQLATRELSVDALFQSVSVMLLFLTPAISMRAFSEEYRTNTFETLATDPVADRALVVGKYLAALAFVALLLIPLAAFSVVLHNVGLARGGLDLGAVATAFVGVIAMAAACLAIGVAISVCTTNQIVAAVVTCIVLVLLYLAHRGATVFTGRNPEFAEAARYLSMSGHQYRFYRGEIALADLVYFASLTAAALGAAVVALDWRRWR